MQIDPQASAVLLEAQSSGQALHALVELRRSRARAFSLAVLSRRTEVSKSYLSEVLSGKKVLSQRYVSAIARGLQLGHLETACLQSLVECDKAKDDAARSVARESLAKTRRIIRLVSLDEAPQGDIDLLEFDVYAAFGCFSQRPTLDDLSGLFPRRPRLEVAAAIDSLLTRKAIVRNEDGTYAYTSRGLVVSTGDRSRAFVDLWRQSLQDAFEKLPRWAERPEESCFASYVVSVRMDHYKKSLEELKNKLLEFAAASDSPEADAVVRINVQAYPVATK